MSAERLTVRCVVDAAHPALPGHFPGDPLVPAALLLRFVGAALEQRGQRLVAVERMKFVRPVRPGEPIDITITPASDERGSVGITCAGQQVAYGTWRSTRD